MKPNNYYITENSKKKENKEIKDKNTQCTNSEKHYKDTINDLQEMAKQHTKTKRILSEQIDGLNKEIEEKNKQLADSKGGKKILFFLQSFFFS